MRIDLIDRIIEEAEYTVLTGATVRVTAKKFLSSKSTVHKDLTERLQLIDKDLYRRVGEVLKKNLSERHIRGGMATKTKYEKLKKE